jgi:hypothetical protein
MFCIAITETLHSDLTARNWRCEEQEILRSAFTSFDTSRIVRRWA